MLGEVGLREVVLRVDVMEIIGLIDDEVEGRVLRCKDGLVVRVVVIATVNGCIGVGRLS